MKSRKHLVLLTAALLLGTLVASAKPGPKPPKPPGHPKHGKACEPFFQGPFLGDGGQVEGSAGKLCYWEGDPTLVHAEIEIPAIESNRTYCTYLTDLQGLEPLSFHNGTLAFGRLLFRDDDLDDEIFFDEDICVDGCGDEGLAGQWLNPAFWVTQLEEGSSNCNLTRLNGSLMYATGFALPPESF